MVYFLGHADGQLLKVSATSCELQLIDHLALPDLTIERRNKTAPVVHLRLAMVAEVRTPQESKERLVLVVTRRMASAGLAGSFPGASTSAAVQQYDLVCPNTFEILKTVSPLPPMACPGTQQDYSPPPMQHLLVDTFFATGSGIEDLLLVETHATAIQKDKEEEDVDANQDEIGGQRERSHSALASERRWIVASSAGWSECDLGGERCALRQSIMRA